MGDLKKFLNTLSNGGFGNSGGLPGLKEEIEQRLKVTDKSSNTERKISRTSDIAPTTVPRPPHIPNKKEIRILRRKIENLTDMVSPSAAERLKKYNQQKENKEDTLGNPIDAINPINIIIRLSTKEIQFSIADHLFVMRSGYTHHGLYVGSGEVIHYTDEGVSKVSLEEFACDANIQVKDSLKIYSNDKIITRAYSRIGENNYNLFDNNCENFVNWCRSGREIS